MNNEKITSGIDEAAINKLMTEIIDYSTKIKSKFNQIEDIVSDTINYYDCSVASKYRSKFNLFKEDLDTVVSNILSYNIDLTNLKSRYKKNISTLSEQINKDTNKIKDNGIW